MTSRPPTFLEALAALVEAVNAVAAGVVDVLASWACPDGVVDGAWDLDRQLREAGWLAGWVEPLEPLSDWP